MHGTGGQTRAFIHIKDTVQCVRLAIENPPEDEKGSRYSIRRPNSITSRNSLRSSRDEWRSNPVLCEPEKEDKENELKLSSQNFLELGLQPITLDEGLMSEIMEVASKYKDRCDESKIVSTSVWHGNILVDRVGSEDPVISNNKLRS